MDKPAFITLPEAKKDKNAILIEILNQESYDLWHIPGAINIPLEELTERSKFLDKTKKAIIYGSGFDQNECEKAVQILQKQGITAVVLKGGKKQWKDI